MPVILPKNFQVKIKPYMQLFVNYENNFITMKNWGAMEIPWIIKLVKV